MHGSVPRWRVGTFILATGVALTTTLSAQQSPQNTSSRRSSAPLLSRSSRLKLSPEQQHGLRLLKAAQAEEAGLQPDMRAFVLWQASHAYTRINPAKSDSLLMDAFRATFAIEQSTSELKECFDPEWCDIQFWLQKHILEEMLARSRQVAPIESLLASAKPQVREELQRDFFQRYIENKEFDKAREQLNQ